MLTRLGLPGPTHDQKKEGAYLATYQDTLLQELEVFRVASGIVMLFFIFLKKR